VSGELARQNPRGIDGKNDDGEGAALVRRSATLIARGLRDLVRMEEALKARRRQVAGDLFQAIRVRDLEKMRTILDADREQASVGDVTGWTPLHEAASMPAPGFTQAVELLLKHGADANAASADGTTALHWAAYMGDERAVAAMIRAKANVNARGEGGKTPLHLAAAFGKTAVVGLLLDAEAEVNAQQTVDGRTALHAAAAAGHVEVLKLLLAHGADVKVTTTQGGTALHVAARPGQVEVARALIEAHADVNARTSQDYTPLHIAAAFGQAGIAKLLVQSGADVTAITNGVTAKELAMVLGHNQVVAVLKQSVLT